MTQSKPLDLEAPTAATYSAVGILHTMQTRPGERNYGECLCCNGRGHVFAYGLDFPDPAPHRNSGLQNDADWIHDRLYAHRFQDGAKVKITVEVLP